MPPSGGSAAKTLTLPGLEKGGRGINEEEDCPIEEAKRDTRTTESDRETPEDGERGSRTREMTCPWGSLMSASRPKKDQIEISEACSANSILLNYITFNTRCTRYTTHKVTLYTTLHSTL